MKMADKDKLRVQGDILKSANNDIKRLNKYIRELKKEVQIHKDMAEGWQQMYSDKCSII
ncbi:hypothetical protein KAR91_57220 [Candidatus Pacearchaeota archaeon]|nr:hypothetical protein [Candidatus Pacearchaeota archaeon]